MKSEINSEKIKNYLIKTLQGEKVMQITFDFKGSARFGFQP